jgi:hypothetical protein
MEFLSGVYPVEYDRNSKWIWTSDKFTIEVNNIEYITLNVTSEIVNKLIYDDNVIEIGEKCLHILKLPVSGKKEISISLEKPFVTVKDTRVLGLRISNILVDGEAIF